MFILTLEIEGESFNRHLSNYLRYCIFDLTIFILFKNRRWKEWWNEL